MQNYSPPRKSVVLLNYVRLECFQYYFLPTYHTLLKAVDIIIRRTAVMFCIGFFEAACLYRLLVAICLFSA